MHAALIYAVSRLRPLTLDPPQRTSEHLPGRLLNCLYGVQRSISHTLILQELSDFPLPLLRTIALALWIRSRKMIIQERCGGILFGVEQQSRYLGPISGVVNGEDLDGHFDVWLFVVGRQSGDVSDKSIIIHGGVFRRVLEGTRTARSNAAQYNFQTVKAWQNPKPIRKLG